MNVLHVFRELFLANAPHSAAYLLSTRVKTFDEYTSEIDNFMSLTTVRIEELRGTMLMVFDPGFISKLTDSIMVAH